jgi:LDH2 family malate/lactate/ureidoglycolate dehydrogenase
LSIKTRAQPTVDVKLAQVEQICYRALSQFITPASAADETVAQLLDAELRGKHSHGLVRIPWLKDTLGPFHHHRAESTQLLPWFLQLRSKKSLGYLIAREGQQALLHMLSEEPFAITVCIDAFPTGVLGDYLRPLAESGYVAVGFATSPPLLSLQPEGKRLLGTNPIAIAMPGENKGRVFVADISPAPSTFGQILAMLSGFEGHLKQVNLATSEGRPPEDLKELFDKQGRFRGKIVQRLENSLERRQYALTLGIELLTKLFIGDSKIGGLVLLAVNPQRFPGMHPDAVTAVIKRIANELDWQGIPGAHGDARQLEIRNRGRVSLPKNLWHRLQAMAEEN